MTGYCFVLFTIMHGKCPSNKLSKNLRLGNWKKSSLDNVNLAEEEFICTGNLGDLWII